MHDEMHDDGVNGEIEEGDILSQDPSQTDLGIFSSDEDSDDNSNSGSSNEAINKLSQAVVMNTKAIEENEKAVDEMVNLLKTKLS